MTPLLRISGYTPLAASAKQVAFCFVLIHAQLLLPAPRAQTKTWKTVACFTSWHNSIFEYILREN